MLPAPLRGVCERGTGESVFILAQPQVLRGYCSPFSYWQLFDQANSATQNHIAAGLAQTPHHIQRRHHVSVALQGLSI